MVGAAVTGGKTFDDVAAGGGSVAGCITGGITGEGSTELGMGPEPLKLGAKDVI